MSSVRGRVIHRAYSDTGALKISCPTCEAPADQYCTRDDELADGVVHWRKIPCLARISRPCSEIAHDDAQPAIDFSEPRHSLHDGSS